MILLSLYLFRSLAIAVYVLMGLFTSNYILSIVIVVVLLSMDFWNTRNVCGRTLVGLRYWNQVDEDGESAWVFESRDVRPSLVFWGGQSTGQVFALSADAGARALSRPAAVDPRQPGRLEALLDGAVRLPRRLGRPLLRLAPQVQRLVRPGPPPALHHGSSCACADVDALSLPATRNRYLPIVALALVFNLSNVLGFTYADRDAKQRWASSAMGGSFGLGSLGGLGGQLVGGAMRNGLGRVLGR